MNKHPNQPLERDDKEVIRFKANPIVRFLLDYGEFDMNDLGILSEHAGFTDDDWAQFAQLIGYSLSGWGDLSYVSDSKYASVNDDG